MTKMLEDLEEGVRLSDRVSTIGYGSERAAAFNEAANASLDFICTHHATIRDMAARLEAAEMDAATCWALHFQGPDDVVAAPSKQAAEMAARNFNAWCDIHKDERGHDVRVVAEVIKWEHGFVEHAKSVIKYWPEYADLLDQAMQEAGR